MPCRVRTEYRPVLIGALWIALLTAPGAAVAGSPRDPVATTLAHCLDDPANASTAGQVACETTALKAYDRRMNAAYAGLLRRLPVAAGERLRRSQRAWLAFRDAEQAARDALYATRHGTMYVPMEAGAATNVTRDRALQLETCLRVMEIEP